MNEEYAQLCRFYEKISGSRVVVAADTGTIALVASRGAKYTIFIQRVHVRVTTSSGGKTWTIQDGNGTPIPVSGALATDVAPSSFEPIDFGPRGLPLTAGQALNLIVSAAGAAGIVTWEGYQRLTSADSAPSTS